MSHSVKEVYVIHHSHTDIGYTDLQERIIDSQANYIKTVIRMLNTEPENEAFRWNCETYFCVEKFFETATEAEIEDFFGYVKKGMIGISGSYLNFNDLVDCQVLSKRVKEMAALFRSRGIAVETAMIADINGISMGQRDVLLENGVKFLFTNIHTHHGMYPLFQNQNAYWWESGSGDRLLVWNGEHYNLGNALGIKANRGTNYMTQNYCGTREYIDDAVKVLRDNLEQYLDLCEENGYPYDFMITSVSGVFSDNAPPNTEILRTIEAYGNAYGDTVRIRMVSLQELYSCIKDKIADVPVYRGDLNDWWGNGVGSTPYIVKHYREARKLYHLCERLNDNLEETYPEEARTAQDNLLLYAEHTWGHSSTISNPYDTMVLNLDIRNSSYASKAHESASRMLNRTAGRLGDIFRYYNTEGRIKVINTGTYSGRLPVGFYIESMALKNGEIRNEVTGEQLKAQFSPHPRGILISFTDEFQAGEEKEYSYKELPPAEHTLNSRKCYVGAERIRDIINDYDPLTYTLPYGIENDWFRINYEIGKGITSFYNKKADTEMLADGPAAFFTPVYERTRLRHSAYSERSILGRNIRGKHAKQYQAVLTDVKCLEHGAVFKTVELVFEMEGTLHCSVEIKMYESIPQLDFKLKTAKTLSEDIESIYMPLTLSLPEKEMYLLKGREAFRPGIDQIPGSCIEYYMTDQGIVYLTGGGSIQITSLDVPLVYMGELRHHPIKLCDHDVTDNNRAVYSWVMNNTWETNFKMDLSGFCEFCYSLSLSGCGQAEGCFEEMNEKALGAYTLIVE